MTERPTPAARALDALALAALVAGSGAYWYASRGMRALAEHREIARPGELLISRFDHYWHAQRAGLAGIALGVALAAWSFLRHRRAAP